MSTSEVIKSMVYDILADKNNDAAEKFNQVVSYKIADSIDAKKQEIAQNLYQGNSND